jgi:DNA-binding HxlR family transcriptional regulator
MDRGTASRQGGSMPSCDLPTLAITSGHHAADQLLGKRWTYLIVAALLDGPCRFSEIATRVQSLSDRTLSVRLGELETGGIVHRRVLTDSKPVRIEYTLTPKGLALRPVIMAIMCWADDWLREIADCS